MADVVWEIDTPGPPPQKTGRENTVPAPDREGGSNPGVAASLSMIFGGMGQFYNGQIKLGFLYFLLMLNVYVLNASIFMNWRTIDASIKSPAFTHVHFGILYGILLILAALVWDAGIIQAYLKALRSRKEPYTGTTHRFLPAFFSLFVPGWGQFLNGQTKKGIFSLAITTLVFLGGVTFILVILFWENFQSTADRLFWEKVLMVSLIPIISAPFLWMVCFYDALVVGLDEVKKEPLWSRLKYANNRRRMKGWKVSVVYPLFITIIFGAALALVGAVGYKYIEKGFYLNTLDSAKVALEQKNMVILPDLIARLQSIIDSM